MTNRTYLKIALFAAAAAALVAQNPGIKRTILTRQDISVPGREAVVASVEIAPGAFAGRHTHPGEEISYVIEGEGEVLIEGRPPLRIRPGSAFIIPALSLIHISEPTRQAEISYAV